jgi:dipeptidase E
MEPQIVAMGGGGFATEPENLLLEQYVLGLSRNRIRPRVCFLPTASGDSQNYIERFYTSFGELDAVPSHLPLFGLTVRDIRAFLLEQDVIFCRRGQNLEHVVDLAKAKHRYNPSRGSGKRHYSLRSKRRFYLLV